MGEQLLVIHSPEQGPLSAHHLPCSGGGNAQQSVMMQDTAALSVTTRPLRQAAGRLRSWEEAT